MAWSTPPPELPPRQTYVQLVLNAADIYFSAISQYLKRLCFGAGGVMWRRQNLGGVDRVVVKISRHGVPRARVAVS